VLSRRKMPRPGVETQADASGIHGNWAMSEVVQEDDEGDWVPAGGLERQPSMVRRVSRQPWRPQSALNEIPVEIHIAP